jgi:hypothetical protein
MVRQQLQRSLGFPALKGVNAYRANGEPDRTGEPSIFCPFLDFVNPVHSDLLALNKDSIFQHGVLSISAQKC